MAMSEIQTRPAAVILLPEFEERIKQAEEQVAALRLEKERWLREYNDALAPVFAPVKMQPAATCEERLQQVVNLLAAHPDGLSRTEILARIDIAYPTLNNYLSRLSMRGIAYGNRHRWFACRPQPGHQEPIYRAILNVLNKFPRGIGLDVIWQHTAFTKKQISDALKYLTNLGFAYNEAHKWYPTK